MPCRLISKMFSGLYAAFAILVFASPAFASGLDTAPGVNSFPFNIQGVPVMNMTSTGLGIGGVAPNGKLDVYNSGANGDGAVFAPDIDLDNNFTIQTYIDVDAGGGWANRVAYAGGCCNNLALQPDVGTVSIGGVSGNYGSNKLNVIGNAYLDGSVGIATATPQAPLDVNGGILGSNSSIVAGSGCSPEGMIGYDLTNHQPVYCSSTRTWTTTITSENYQTSCTYISNPGAYQWNCCRINANNGVVDCKYTDNAETWIDIPSPWPSAATGKFSLSCAAIWGLWTCVRTNVSTGTTQAEATTNAVTWTAYTSPW